MRQALIVGVLISAAWACQQTPASQPAANATPTPAGQAKEEVKEAADKVAAGAKEAGDKLAEGARKLQEKVGPEAKRIGEKVAEGAQSVGTGLSGAKETVAIKAALVADDRVDAAHIDVDTDSDSKTVSLRGTVPNAAQKAAAEQIAAKHAPGYRIKNELRVAP
jgi:osmotically-inducible protein OsmY